MKYAEALQCNYHHFTALQKIVAQHGYPKGGGSYMMSGYNLNYDERTYQKQKALFNTAKDSDTAIEVGVYAGHSLFIMLMANDHITIDAIDLGFPFTRPCVEYLNQHFNNRVTYYEGNSLTYLPILSFKQYDLIHIDGCHDPEHIAKELRLIEPMAKKYLVVDDIEGAIFGMNDIMPVLTLVERPQCFNPNAVYRFTHAG